MEGLTKNEERLVVFLIEKPRTARELSVASCIGYSMLHTVLCKLNSMGFLLWEDNKPNSKACVYGFSGTAEGSYAERWVKQNYEEKVLHL